MREIARATARASPASTRSDKPTLAGKELTGDDKALNLAGPLADRCELDVAEEFLGRIIFDETVAAVYLDAVLGGPHGDLARVQLGHRGLERRPLPLVFERSGTVRQQARRLDPGCILDELRADALERPDGLAELLPHERIVARRLVRALREPDRERRNANPSRVEHLQRVDESLSLFAQQVERRHAAILEEDLARLARAHPELVLFLAKPEPRGPAFDDEGGNAAVSLAPIGHGHHDHRVAVAAVCDELLRTVDDPAVALP